MEAIPKTLWDARLYGKLSPGQVPARRGRRMKYITAIIKPFKFTEVKDALSAAGVSGLTVSEVSGYGRQKGQTEIYRGAEYAKSMLPKVRIEVAVPDSLEDRVVEIIRQHANNDEIGDGKIFVFPLEVALRIRTGEQGDDAL
jgi:nitrogen regulatory protein P-II 2